MPRRLAASPRRAADRPQHVRPPQALGPGTRLGDPPLTWRPSHSRCYAACVIVIATVQAPPVSGVSPPEAPPLSASASGSNDPEAPSTAVPVATDTGLPSPLVISSPVCGAPSLDGSGSGGVPSSGPRRRSAGLEQRLAALAVSTHPTPHTTPHHT